MGSTIGLSKGFWEQAYCFDNIQIEHKYFHLSVWTLQNCANESQLEDDKIE